jgi:hypothetical protein
MTGVTGVKTYRNEGSESSEYLGRIPGQQEQIWKNSGANKRFSVEEGQDLTYALRGSL